jgi:hypothetical protein
MELDKPELGRRNLFHFHYFDDRTVCWRVLIDDFLRILRSKQKVWE